MRNVLNLTAAAALALSGGAVLAGEVKYDTPVNIDLVFIYHIAASGFIGSCGTGSYEA